MKIFKLSIIVLLIFVVSTICAACGDSDFGFDEKDDVYAISFSINNYSDAKDKNGYVVRNVAEENSRAIDEACEILLKNVYYNKKLPSKDFWSRKEIEYKEPTNGVYVNFLFEGGSYDIKIYSGRVYKCGVWDRYSENGNEIASIIQRSNLTITDSIE